MTALPESLTFPWRPATEPEWRAVLASTAGYASTDSEQALIVDVCANAVRAGGHLLAWYGRYGHSQEDPLRPVAVFGPAAAYLDDAPPEWVNAYSRDEASNPVLRALATNECVFSQDLAADDGLAPWSERAITHGFRSFASLPVPVQGVLDGVLTMYSGQVGAFDETAVATLGILCAQVGNGIARYRAATRVNEALEATIRVLSQAVEARDPYTAGHQLAVSALSEQIATRLGLDPFEVQGIRLAALVHDIGKVGIPSELLLKRGPMRAVEMTLIREHVNIGVEVLATIDFPWPLATVVEQHHERLDGTGYPNGTSGDDILLAARIIAVADTVDAMTRDRPYKFKATLEQTIEALQAGTGSLYDPTVTQACITILVEASQLLVVPPKPSDGDRPAETPSPAAAAVS